MATGRCEPTIASTAVAKAMSVAVGIAQPPMSSPPPLLAAKATKIRAGTATPPKAAAIGTAALPGLRSSPSTNSCFSSRPTRKKNTASRASAAQWLTLRSRVSRGLSGSPRTGPKWKSLTDS